jgi:putative transcriptional regulator
MTSGTQLAKAIAGEIAMAGNPGDIIEKWREVFELNKRELAKEMNVSPSVISDYESGRRKSPGAGFIKNMVESLVRKDAERGGKLAKDFTVEKRPEAILAIRELSRPVSASRMLDAIDGVTVGKIKPRDVSVKGYTVINSIKAIVELSDDTLRAVYGATTQRALAFTKVHSGRSPLIAIKVTKPKPSMIILHGLKPKSVDKLAIKIADSQGIPLAVSNMRTEEDLIKNLENLK